MLNRKTLLAFGLASAIGIPLATSSSGDFVDSVSNRVSGWIGTGSDEEDGVVASNDPALEAGPGKPRIEGLPVGHLGEVFSFDVTPAWILSRWSRVSTQVGPLEFQGYRVPLLTGVQQGDLAGTLTYCFNDRQELQRLTFQGTTDDPSRLISLAVARFGFAAAKAPTPGQRQYEIGWNGRANSRLNVRMAGVVDTKSTKTHYSINIEINLPDVLPSWYQATAAATLPEKPANSAQANNAQAHDESQRK